MSLLDSIFELRGPTFLLLYWLLAAGLITAVLMVGGWLESGPVPRLDVVDPYLVAYLRGGPNAATSVAVLSLVDRGLLTVDGRMVKSVEGAAQKVRRDLERIILIATQGPQLANVLPADTDVKPVLAAMQTELCQLGLVPTRRQKVVRALLSLVAAVVLWLVASYKIDVALEHGHTNVGFLSFSPWAVTFVLLVLINRRLTSTGRRLLRDLRELFGGLKARAATLEPGGATNEAALLAAVFGVAAVEQVGSWATASALFPLNTNQGSGGSSSCGSSCGGGGGGCGGCGS